MAAVSSLVALSLMPFVLQVAEAFIISSNIIVKGIDVTGQIEWYGLINETMQAFLIIPLYSILHHESKYYKIVV